MQEKKYRLPRKIKKQIPPGPYCYEALGYDKLQLRLHVKYCPFHTFIKMKDKPESMQDEIDKEYPEERVEWCKKIQCEIDDSCKSCSVKSNWK